jgi:hypothetical protein
VARIPQDTLQAFRWRWAADIHHAERLENGCGHEPTIGYRCQGDEDDTIRTIVVHTFRHGQGESRFANAGGTGQGDQACLASTQSGP